MSRWLRLLIAPALLLSVFFGPSPRIATGSDEDTSTMVVMPTEGHEGDTFYLFGTGFKYNESKANNRLFLTMACPTYRDAVKYNTQHPNMQVTYDTSIEPQIDAHGAFIHAVRWKALSLVGSKSMDCTLYALDGVNPFGPAFPPTYTILAPDQPVSPCWRRICIEIKERTRRTGSGLVETVHIAPRPVRDREHPVRPGLYAWPGADATVTLWPPGGPVKQRVRLDMSGEADANFPIARHLKGPVRVSVQVKVQLGSWSGGDSGKFILSP